MRAGSTVLIFLATLATAAGQVRAQECFFGESAVLDEVTLADGVAVRRFQTHLRYGNRLLSPCNGLPAEHPTAIAPFGDGLAVGFRAAGVYLYRDGTFISLPDSLPSNVRALASDGDTLFIGTTRGLHQFNGREVSPLGHGRLRRVITALLASDGALHVGLDPTGWWKRTGNGPFRIVSRNTPVGCFREDGRVRALPPGPTCSPAAAQSSHYTAVTAHHGQLFLGTFERGLVTRNAEGHFVPVPLSPRFINTLVSDGDTLWVGTAQGLYAMREGRFSPFDPGLPSQHINGLMRSRSGELWIATSAGLMGLHHARTRLFDRRNGLPSRIIYAVTQANDDAIWVGTAEGAARISTDGIRVYRRESGNLPHNWVTALIPDGEGVLAGTYDSGVVRLSPDGRAVPVPGLERLWVNPHGIRRHADRLYVSTLGDGLWVHGEGEPHAVSGLPSSDVTGVAVSGGDLWIATRGGLATARP